MAFGTASKVFTAFLENAIENATAYAIVSDTVKCALFNDTISSPDQTVSQANTAFGVGVWASGEAFNSTHWPTGGNTLASKTGSFTGNVYTYDAADTASDASATLSDVRGCLIYDTTVSSFGLCFLSFGGAKAVTAGTFTVVFNGSGIMSITA